MVGWVTSDNHHVQTCSSGPTSLNSQTRGVRSEDHGPFFLPFTFYQKKSNLLRMNGFRILDTYRAYKVREQKFTTWLNETPDKVGNETSKSDRVSRHAVRINEIPNLAKLIISRDLSIPENVRQVLRDVISQRKEASAFYQPKGEADDGHAYYITVLEDTLKTFENGQSSNGKNEASCPRTEQGRC
jgi:hypothetical protein